MSPRVQHLALDGSLVTIRSVSTADLDTEASSVAIFSVDGIAREFTASHRTFGVDVAEYYGADLPERYSLQGGELLVGSTIQVWPELDNSDRPLTSLLRVGVWQGQQHSVVSHVYGGESADVVHLFSQFEITETASGIQMEPLLASTTRHFHEPSVLKELPSIGLLDIAALTTTETRRLPRWHGTQLLGGELFTDEVGAGGQYYVLVGHTARTLVMPPSDCDHSSVLRGLQHLQVSWERPSR
jgi:hypothetical protein